MKMQRKRGYQALEHVETPPALRSELFARSARSVKRFSSPAPFTPTPMGRQLPKYTKILRFLGESEETIEYLGKHLPSKNVRHSPDFWSEGSTIDGTSQTGHVIIMNVFVAVLFCVAESLCGSDGGALSLVMFRQWFAEPITGLTAPQQTQATTVTRSQGVQLHRHIVQAATAIIPTKKGSIERRVARAVLCGAFPLRRLQDVGDQLPSFHLGKGSYTQGRKDYDALCENGFLFVERHSRARFSTRAVDAAIAHIMSHDNVSYLSWGTRRVLLSGKVYEAPALLRKKPISVMFEEYTATPVQLAPVSRSTFYRLCNALTKGQTQARKAVDYVSGFLVYDTVCLLRKIVGDLLPQDADGIYLQLEVLQAWLKYGTTGYLSSGSSTEQNDCPRHDILFGLLPSTPTMRSTSCEACLSMEKIMVSIPVALEAAGADTGTLGVVKDIQHKIDLFLGHRLRVLNQQREIELLMRQMEERCALTRKTTEALIVFDFKMKSEPLYFREKTAEHYGKRGMSWHGALVRYWEIDSDDPTATPTEEKLYYDHLSSSDNLQDKGAVLSLLEAAMIALKRDLPCVVQLVGQSDNASSYQNACVKLLFPVIGAAHGHWVTRFLHTDTQDGKSVLDAHFAQAGRKIGRWVQQGNNCVTPSQLLVGVTSNGGLPNTVAELVEYDRQTIRGLFDYIFSMEKMFNKHVDRANDIGYSRITLRPPVQTAFDLSTVEDFVIEAYSYSGVGEPTRLKVSFSSRSCTRLDHETRVATTVREEQGVTYDDEDAREQAMVDDGDDEINDHADSDLSDDDEIDEDELSDDLTLDSVNPSTGCGIVTKVGITTMSQIRRRMRKWKSSSGVPNTLITRGIDIDEPAERDIASYGKYHLVRMKSVAGVAIVSASGLSHQLASVAEALPEVICYDARALRQGWARRPARGQMYGAKYIHAFVQDIRDLFERGAQNKSDKLGPARMLEDLQGKYPGRYDLPSENEIRAEIGKLFTQTRRRARSDGGEVVTHQRLVRPRTHNRPEVDTFIEDLIRADINVKPLVALVSYRARYGDEHGLSDKQIKAKVSYMKKIKKDRHGCQTPPPHTQGDQAIV